MASYSEFEDEKFFAEYAQMPCSKEGLSAAGEWHQLKPLFPSLQDKKCLIWDVDTVGIANMRRSRAHRRFSALA